MMKINEPVPSIVDISKMLNWEEASPLKEGIMSIETIRQECKGYCNFVLFYCWCYARTQGFTNKCMKNWDFGNFGGMFKTSRDGIKDALSEFLRYEDTSLLAEQAEVEKLYKEIIDFCGGIVWTEPDIPVPPKPEPKPEEPKPPVPPKPEEPKPEEPKAPFNWAWAKWAAVALGVVSGTVGIFLPKYVTVIIDFIAKALNLLSTLGG
jgi:hypothetical protein